MHHEMGGVLLTILAVQNIKAQLIPPNPNGMNPSRALGYYENKGQIIYPDGTPTDVLYYSEKGVSRAYIRPDRLSVVSYTPEDTIFQTDAKSYRFDIRFVGNDNYTETIVNNVSAINLHEPTGDHLNYYLPHCPAGIEDAKGYQRIIYEDAWPDIDFHTYSNPMGLCNIIVVEPGADLSKIRFKFEGQDSMTIDNVNPSLLDGHMDGQDFRFPIVQSYQFSGSTIIPLSWTPSWLDLGGDFFGLNSYGSFDPNLPLVFRIEVPYAPTPLSVEQGIPWRTYYGNLGDEFESYLASDQNNLYHIMSNEFDANFQSIFPPINGQNLVGSFGRDLILSSFDQNSYLRNWATYIAGPADDFCTDIAVGQSTNQDLIISGYTFDNSLPLNPTGINLFQDKPTTSNGVFGFIESFYKSNGYINWGSWLGASPTFSFPNSLRIIEHNGLNKLVVGGNLKRMDVNDLTSSNSTIDVNKFPVKNIGNSYFHGNNVQNSLSKGFIMLFDLNTHTLDYSTLIHNNGNFDDIVIKDVTAQNISAKLNIVAVGYVDVNNSAPIYQNNNAYFQTTNTNPEGFLVRFGENSNGEFIQNWGTYFGGSGSDKILSVDINPINQELLICGVTNTIGQAANSDIANNLGAFPNFHTNNEYTSSYGGNYDNFLATFNINGSLNWSTYFGGEDYEGAFPSTLSALSHRKNTGKAIYDRHGNIVLSGTSANLISTPTSTLDIRNLIGAYNQDILAYGTNVNNPEYCDIYIGYFKNKELGWCTYYGGDNSAVFGQPISNIQPLSAEYDSDIISSKSSDLIVISTLSHSIATPGNCSTTQYCQNNFIGKGTDATLTAFEYNPSNIYPTSVTSKDVRHKPYIFSSHKGHIRIKPSNVNEKILEINIVDILGRKLIEQPNLGRTFDIDLKHFAPSVYIISIFTYNNQYHEKVSTH